MNPESILELTRKWFRGIGGSSLKLPSGWFGRPYDNRHNLTASFAVAQRLILVLDNQMVLTLAHPTAASAVEKQLVISGFNHGSLDWDEFGEPRPHLDGFGGGQVEFISP